MNRLIKTILLLSLVVLIISNYNDYSYCQTIGAHNLGKFYGKILPADMSYGEVAWDRSSWSANGTFTDCFLYPSGTYRRDLILDRITYVLAEAIDFSTGVHSTDFYTGTMPVSVYEMSIYRRWREPSIIVDGQDETNDNSKTIIDHDLVSDIMVDHYGTIRSFGMGCREKSYSYANENHQDYIIYDITFEMDFYDPTASTETDKVRWPTDQKVNLFFNPGYAFIPCRIGGTTLLNTQLGYNAWFTSEEYSSQLMLDGKIPSRPRNSLKISYSYNADMKDLTSMPGAAGSLPILDDTGDPDPISGEFLSPQYVGYALFHADKSSSDESDDPDKPVNVGWLYRLKHFNAQNWEGCETHWEYCNWRRIKKEAFIEDGVDTPESDSYPIHYQTIGPYNEVVMGDDVRIVYAVGAGMIDRALCHSKGAEWYQHYMNNDANMTSYDNEKNELIAQGKDLLFEHIDRAYWTYAARNMDIPDPPPAPDITVTSGPGKNVIEWSYPDANMYKDPDTGVDDFKEWKIYRKTGAYLEDDPQDGGIEFLTYEEIATVPRNSLKYEDNNIVPLEHYHYCVRGFDDGSANNGLDGGKPLGSSFYNNRTKAPAVPYKKGYNTSDEVLIVPNPYSVSTGATNAMNFTGYSNEIQFVQIPCYCTLKIYTATGDLIQTINHTSGSDSERWEELRTTSNQRPVSGVYILAVDNAKDENNTPLPTKFYKFVIVR